MAESGDKFNGTVTWFDGRTGFCLIKSNVCSDEFFVHRSFVESVGFSAPTVGETVEVVIVKRNNEDPEILWPTFTDKSYIQRWKHLGSDKGLVESDEDEGSEKVEEIRNWAMLPLDILSIIFKKAGAAVVVASAQFVCKPWQQVSKETDLWRCVHIKLNDALSISTKMTDDDLNMILLEFIAMVAVDRSDGCLEEFSVEGFGTNVLMDYIAQRATRLRCLGLISVHDMSDEAVVEAVKRFPDLEEFWISPGSFSSSFVTSVCCACPLLKSLTVSSQGSIGLPVFENFLPAIAKHMHQLRRLEISTGVFSNSSLCTLLDGCPHLEYLDISGCHVFDMDENLKTKCASIKEVRLPSIISLFADLSSIEILPFEFDYFGNEYI